MTDVTQFKVCDKKIYLSPLVDLHTKEVLSYSVSQSPNVSFVMEMMESGLPSKSYENTIVHTDQGLQYQNIRFRKYLESKDIKQSMSRKGNCYDNAVAENFFSQLKGEFFYTNKFTSVNEFLIALDEYISYYNNDRIVTKLKMSPVEYRNHCLKL